MPNNSDRMGNLVESDVVDMKGQSNNSLKRIAVPKINIPDINKNISIIDKQNPKDQYDKRNKNEEHEFTDNKDNIELEVGNIKEETLIKQNNNLEIILENKEDAVTPNEGNSYPTYIAKDDQVLSDNKNIVNRSSSHDQSSIRSEGHAPNNLRDNVYTKTNTNDENDGNAKN